MTKQDVKVCFFFVYCIFVFAIYNLRIVIVQPECLLEGGLLLMREGKPFFSVDLFQISPSES